MHRACVRSGGDPALGGEERRASGLGWHAQRAGAPELPCDPRFPVPGARAGGARAPRPRGRPFHSSSRRPSCWRVGVAGRGAQSPNLGLRGPQPALAGGVGGGGCLRTLLPPLPPGPPTPRPLLLGKPAGAAGGRPGGLPRPLRHPSGGRWVTHPAVTAQGVARRGGGVGPAGPEVDGRLRGPAGPLEPPGARARGLLGQPGIWEQKGARRA